VEAVEKAGCVGIPGLTNVFADRCQLQRGFFSQQQIKEPGLSLVQLPTPSGEPLQIVVTYTDNGEPVAQALPIALTTEPANALDCTNAPQEGAQVFTCRPLLKLDSTVVVATGPNPIRPLLRVRGTLVVGNLSEYCQGLGA
jgi:hypothetical protein